MLYAERLKARYGKAEPVFSDLSFSLPEGGVLAVLGPSGCGKTTLLRVLAGLHPPEAGRVLLDGRPLGPKTAAIGYIPQDYGLLPWKTVGENIRFCAGLKKNARGEAALCERLGLSPLLDRFPGSLSGGQAQRAALARALLMKPRLLLMDEPFSALDAAGAREAELLCLTLLREGGKTAVFVTHRPEEAVFLATHLAVMEGGRLSHLLKNPLQGLRGEKAGRLAQRLRRILLSRGGAP